MSTDDTTPVTRADLRRFGEAMRSSADCDYYKPVASGLAAAVTRALATIPAASEAGACKRFVCICFALDCPGRLYCRAFNHTCGACNGKWLAHTPEARGEKPGIPEGMDATCQGCAESSATTFDADGYALCDECFEACGDAAPVTTAEVTDSGYKDEAKNEEETVRWLIEDDLCSPTTYVCQGQSGYGLSVTTDVMSAMMFGTEAEAQAVIANSDYVGPERRGWVARGHIWLGSAPPLSPTPGGSSPGTSDDAGGDATSEQRSEQWNTGAIEMVDAALSEAVASTAAQRKAEESAAFVSGSVGSFRCGSAAGDAVAGAHAFECEHHNDHETAHNDECVCRCGKWQDHRLHAAPTYPDPDGMPPLPTVGYKDPRLDVGYGLHPEQRTGWPAPGLVPLVSRVTALAREAVWRRECARLRERLDFLYRSRESGALIAMKAAQDKAEAERDELRAKLAAVEEDTQELVSALGELRILAEGVIRERGPLGDKTVDRILRRAADALAKLAAAKEALA